jgi:uncharacterized repeat protein (TIGR03803 family)
MLWLRLVQFGLAFMPAANAQTYTNLYSFTVADSTPFTNRDGANPKSRLISSGNTLYGTVYDGGSSGNGSVFKIHADGTGFTNLYSFSGPYNNHAWVTNDDGANPQAGLVLFSNTLFGTASSGGLAGNGTVFAIGTDGAGFTNLHSFSARSASAPYSNSDGSLPEAGLILSGRTLYGTAESRGRWGAGVVFAINADGTGFTNLYNFTVPGSTGTNSDGGFPEAGLILSGNTLYGTTYNGGAFGGGAVFAIHTNGTGFVNLGSFDISGGFDSYAGLTLLNDALYGTTIEGGAGSAGTIFKITLCAPPQLSIAVSGTNIILT